MTRGRFASRSACQAEASRRPVRAKAWSTNTNATARLRPGSAYYLGIQALNFAGPVNVSLQVNFDQTSLPAGIPQLSSGVPLAGFIPRTTALNQFQFNVPIGASAAAFELLNPSGDVNLYVLRSNGPGALPGPGQIGRAHV